MTSVIVTLNCWLVVILSPSIAQAIEQRTVSTTYLVDSLVARPAKVVKEPAWITVSGSLDIVYPNAGGDGNVFGYAWRAGFIWKNLILLFTNHAARATSNPLDLMWEHRYDYSLLFGSSLHTGSSFLNVCGGICYMDFRLRGGITAPPSVVGGQGAIYAQRAGTSFGPAARINWDLTGQPLGIKSAPFSVGLGLGLFGALINGASYVGLELTLFEINVPVKIAD